MEDELIAVEPGLEDQQIQPGTPDVFVDHIEGHNLTIPARGEYFDPVENSHDLYLTQDIDVLDDRNIWQTTVELRSSLRRIGLMVPGQRPLMGPLLSENRLRPFIQICNPNTYPFLSQSQ